jgi:hypothetical protein
MLILDSWNDLSSSGRPRFRASCIDHHDKVPAEHHRCGVARVKTFDKREYEWLCVFLQVVTWMERAFPNAKALEDEGT